jgi:hypothetical protein
MSKRHAKAFRGIYGIDRIDPAQIRYVAGAGGVILAKRQSGMGT